MGAHRQRHYMVAGGDVCKIICLFPPQTLRDTDSKRCTQFLPTISADMNHAQLAGVSDRVI